MSKPRIMIEVQGPDGRKVVAEVQFRSDWSGLESDATTERKLAAVVRRMLAGMNTQNVWLSEIWSPEDEEV